MITKIVEYYLKKKNQNSIMKNKDSENKDYEKSISNLRKLTTKINNQEKKLKLHYDIVETENNILKMITHGLSVDEILNEIVIIIERFLPNVYCSILENIDGVLYDRHSPNLPNPYLEFLKTGIKIGPNDRSCGACAYYKTKIISENIFDDPKWLRCPEVLKIAKEHGISSSYSFPIIGYESNVLGTITIYAKDKFSDLYILNMILEWASQITSVTIERDISYDKLKENEQRLDFAMTVKNEGIWEWDVLNGHMIFDNRYYEMIGYEPNEFSASFESWKKLIHPDDIEESLKKVNEYLNGQINELNFEFRFRHKEGHYVWIHSQGKIANKDTAGKLEKLIGIHKDITARKEAEIKLQKTNNLLTSILETQHDLIIRISKDGNLIYANSEFSKFFNIPNDEIINNSIYNFIHPDDVTNMKAHVECIFREKCRKLFECRLINRNNEIRYFRWESNFVNDNLQGVGRDNTEKKKAEKRLLNQYNFQAMLMNISNLFINVPLYKLENNIQNALEKITKFMNADRGYIFEYECYSERCDNVYEYCQDDDLQIDLKKIDFKELCEEHKKGNSVYISDVSVHWNDYIKQLLEGRNVKSLITVPMVNNGKCHGFIGFEYVNNYANYLDDEKKLLHVFANMIVNVYNRKAQDEELKSKTNYLEGILTIQNFCITILNKEFKIIYANKTEIDTFFGDEVYLGVNLIEHHIHKDFHELFYNKLEDFNSSENDHIDIKVIDKNKNLKWYRSFIKTLFQDEDIKEIQIISYDVTEEIQNSEEIKKIAQDYESILDYTNVLIWHMSDFETYGVANKTFLDFFGIESMDHLYGKKINELSLFPNIEKCVEDNQYIFDNKESLKSLEWIKNHEDENRLLSINKNPVLYNDNVNHIICTGIDTTDEYNAKINLKTSEKKFKLMVNQSQMMIFVVRFDGTLSFISSSVNKLLGYSEKELINRPFKTLILEEDYDKIENFLNEVIKDNSKSDYIECRLCHKNGSVKWHKIAFNAIYENNEFINFVGNSVDVTDTKLANINLSKAFSEYSKKNDLLRAILYASHGYLWYKDKDYIYKFCDDRFKKDFFALEPSFNTTGWKDIDLITKYQKESGNNHEFDKLCDITDEHTKKISYQCRYIQGGLINNKLFVLEILKTPLFDKNNEYVGSVGFAWDRSNEIDMLIVDIQKLKSKNRIEVLSDKEYPENPFIYYIKSNKKHKRTYVYRSLTDEPKIVSQHSFIFDGEQNDNNGG